MIDNFVFGQYQDWVRIIYKGNKFISISPIDGLHLWLLAGDWESNGDGLPIIDGVDEI